MLFLSTMGTYLKRVNQGLHRLEKYLNLEGFLESP